mgnify:CR=1 FL=1
MAVRERHREELKARSDRFVDIVQAQQDRYLWFWDQIDEPRSVEECRAVLYDRPEWPAAWERALVELSRWTTTSAKLTLEGWEPPAGNLELELFHKICLSHCRDAYGRPGGEAP